MLNFDQKILEVSSWQQAYNVNNHSENRSKKKNPGPHGTKCNRSDFYKKNTPLLLLRLRGKSPEGVGRPNLDLHFEK